MRMVAMFLLITAGTGITPLPAQVIPGGASGDFRVNDRPGNITTVGPPGGPSQPPDATLFRDSFSGKSPDDILKSLDRALGRDFADKPGRSDLSSDPGRDLRAPSEKRK